MDSTDKKYGPSNRCRLPATADTETNRVPRNLSNDMWSFLLEKRERSVKMSFIQEFSESCV